MPARKESALSAAIPAKVSPPRLTETYRRGRLFRALDHARRRGTVWISAPAGAGKTSVVTSYLAARRLPALWYNVDARDVDVANLFHYLATASSAASPRRKQKIPPFKAENQAGIAAFARGFFEALARERPASSVIVLDDYQEAKSELWNEVIREGLSAVPKTLSVIVISRADPPASFARLIASSEIHVLGPEDLRLTPKEMIGLVHLYRPDLRGRKAKARVDRICELANGWAAALTLLLQERDIGAFSPTGFEHCSARLFDYFATEVLDKMTAPERDVLLKTSILSVFTVELAGHLTDAAGAGRMLVDFERRSFLTQRLGSSGAYRYHPLLREFLLRQAERELGREALRGLHHRAAELLAAAGLIDEAMEQLETVRDVASRARLIVRAAPSYVASGRSRTVESWIARLPAECVEFDGWLSYWAAISCVDHAPSRARELLERAYAVFAQSHDTAGLYGASAAAIQAIVHEGMDLSRLDAWVERLERMRAEGPPCPEALAPTVATGMLIASTFRRRAPAEGRYWAERAMSLAMTSEDLGHRVITGGFLAFYFALHDDAARASVILEMLRATARAAELSPLSVLTLLQADAVCSWVRGENTTCIVRAREALVLAARTGIFVWNVYLQTLGLASALSADDRAGAREFLEMLAQSAQSGSAFVLGGYHFNASWEALSAGDVPRALRSAELACHYADLLGYPLAHCVANQALASALFHAGRVDEAIAALRRARGHAEDIDSPYLLHGCDVHEADFLWEVDREQARVCLERGLRLARTRNYHDMFCASRALRVRIAERALEHGIETAYVRESIVRHRLTPTSAASRLEHWPWRYRLRALGAFEIVRDREGAHSAGPVRDDDRGAPRGMPLRLLRAIVALGAREVRDESLIDALWPDAEGDAGRRVFDTTLHRLRRQLGDEQILRLNDGRVGLDERLCWLDTWAAEALFSETARELERGAAPSVLLALARRLLALYRGPLLADEGAASWAREPRDRFAAKFDRTAEDLGRALEASGEFRQAALLFERILDGDPLAERGYAGLMRCAAATGHRADALQLFEKYRTKLAATLGTAPGRELADLRSRLATKG